MGVNHWVIRDLEKQENAVLEHGKNAVQEHGNDLSFVSKICEHCDDIPYIYLYGAFDHNCHKCSHYSRMCE